MSKKNYVGQYLINTVGQVGWCRQDVGECIWQDTKNLLCAHYEDDSSGRLFHSILLIPVRLAKKINWYAAFDEFYETIAGHSNRQLEINMTEKERDGIHAIEVLPTRDSKISWSSEFSYAGNCVAKLTRCLKERPDAGTYLVDYITAEAAKHKARMVTIQAIAKMISDAELSADEMRDLTLVAQTRNEFDDDIPF